VLRALSPPRPPPRHAHRSQTPPSIPAFKRAHPLPPHAGVLGGLQKQAVVDIDANNAGNPLACAEYARDIFDHLHEVEVSAAARGAAAGARACGAA
jgi:hypothetical protein